MACALTTCNGKIPCVLSIMSDGEASSGVDLENIDKPDRTELRECVSLDLFRSRYTCVVYAA